MLFCESPSARHTHTRGKLKSNFRHSFLCHLAVSSTTTATTEKTLCTSSTILYEMHVLERSPSLQSLITPPACGPALNTQPRYPFLPPPLPTALPKPTLRSGFCGGAAPLLFTIGQLLNQITCTLRREKVKHLHAQWTAS